MVDATNLIERARAVSSKRQKNSHSCERNQFDVTQGKALRPRRTGFSEVAARDFASDLFRGEGDEPSLTLSDLL